MCLCATGVTQLLHRVCREYEKAESRGSWLLGIYLLFHGLLVFSAFFYETGGGGGEELCKKTLYIETQAR